jgi:hypothetical protein
LENLRKAANAIAEKVATNLNEALYQVYQLQRDHLGGKSALKPKITAEPMLTRFLGDLPVNF